MIKGSFRLGLNCLNILIINDKKSFEACKIIFVSAQHFNQFQQNESNFPLISARLV
jgi:hypothetical protein